MVDGSEYRAAIRTEFYGNVYFGDTLQEELFWCSRGG